MSAHHALACEECRTLLGGYVLAALEPEEMDAVREHVAACVGCAREYAELAPMPAMLDAAGSTDSVVERPPPALEEAVLDRFARERVPGAAEDVQGSAADTSASGRAAPGSAAPRDGGRFGRLLGGGGRRPLRAWLSRPAPAAATAAAVATLATLGIGGLLGGSGDSGPHEYGAWLRGSAAAPGARAYAKLSTREAGTGVDLRVQGVRPAPGVAYELWCVGRDGTRVSAGTFRVDDTGGAHVRLTTAARLGEYDRLTVERLTPGQPGQRVLAGSIEY